MKHKCQLSLSTRLCTLLQVLQVFALFGLFMLVSTPQSEAGVADTTPPQVFPPKDITISHTGAGGARAQDSKSLQDFLASGKARDNADAHPTKLTPQVNGADATDSTQFPEGTTAVTFRFSDSAGNIGTATATVTVLDFEDGDLFVGGEVADNGFGDIAVAGIYRVRGDQATIYCQSGSGSDFWAIPSNVMVDSQGRVVFLALLGSPFGNANTGLLRCNSLGAPAEKLAVFRFPGFGVTPGYPDPFPDKSFLQFNGLHLETSNNVVIDDNTQNGVPQISGRDSYVLSFSPPGPNTDRAGSLRYFPDAGQWLGGPSVGDVGKAGGQGFAPDMAFHDGATYVATGNAILRDKNGLNVSINGHISSLDFRAILNIFGSSGEISPNLQPHLTLNDLNTPDIDSGCQPNPPASSAMPFIGNGFTSLDGVDAITYDEYTQNGLVVGTNSVGAGFPFLTQVSEAIFDGMDVPTFTQPFLGCAAVPELEFRSVLPFFGQNGINGFTPLVSSTHGIVGIARSGVAVMARGADPNDEAFLITNQPWISGHSGVGAWPPRVSSGETANVIIRVDSPVNILVTSPDGKQIGVDDAGQSVNDFGNDGFDSGPGEPRFFAVNNPSPGAYALQMTGTGTGPYSVHVYSNDMTLPVGSHIVTTGTASQGSAASADFNLAHDFQVTFASPGGSSDTTPPSTVVWLSPQPNRAGWNNTDVTVSLAATDDQSSGVKQLTYMASGAQPIASTTAATAFATFTISKEGQTAITFFAADNADNVEAQKQAAVMLDKTAPGINCGVADGFWHAADVSIGCGAKDSLSGLASFSDSSFTLTTSVPVGSETTNALTGTHNVCDIAGNCTNAGPVGGNMIDKKPPIIVITAPTHGTYLLDQAVIASYSCTDGGSGVATCAGSVPVGTNVNTASVGSNTFTVKATDKVGNAAIPQSMSYTVAYNVCALFDSTRAVQSGATIPIKVQICDANRADVSNASTVLHATKLVQTSSNASETIQDSGNANPDNDFRYDSTLGPTGGYIFNLSTKGLATGIYALSFTAGADPSTHTVIFQVR